MSERTRNGKTFAQDALGFLFCLVGGFFAVSIVLSLRGQRPKPGLISALTWPVIEIATLLGAWTALLFSAGLAVLGTTLFLRATRLSALRPLLALLSASLGLATILGAFGVASELGAWLPRLVPGLVGSMLALVLGLAMAWLGWTLLATERAPHGTSADVLQRVQLAARHDSAGVSPAEAALLVNEPRAPAPRPAPRREVAAPLRDETIRPFTPNREAPASEPRPPSAPARAKVEPQPVLAAPAALPLAAERGARGDFSGESDSSGGSDSVSVLTPPAPSWEGLPEEEHERDEEEAQRLSEALGVEFETEEMSASEAAAIAGEEVEEEVEEEPDEAGEDIEASDQAPARASWEQAGLFDEEEAEEEEAESARPAKVELTSTFDFDAPAHEKAAHEPEPPGEESPPVASASGGTRGAARAATRLEEELEEEEEGENEGDEEPVVDATRAAAAPPPRPEVVPAPAPKPEPSLVRDAEGERWTKLVYEAGCAILEQKRVAVSMLERRFGIDFDQACRVLDELQQAGLIGPYMGGRTRDILLTREQWLPHAPHAS
jgi:DNA segregation ATPase FtsK/SpoIIIE-like protein